MRRGLHLPLQLARPGLALIGVLVLLVGGPALAAQQAAGWAQPLSALPDFTQCANDQFPSTATDCAQNWINGALNSNNSHYSEDAVVPQRFVFEITSGGLTGHT